MPKDPNQKLNYNHIRSDKVRREKDISFLFIRGNTASSSLKQNSTCVPTVTECNTTVSSSQSKYIFS